MYPKGWEGIGGVRVESVKVYLAGKIKKNDWRSDIVRDVDYDYDDFINGRIVEYARELGIKVPINALLTYLVKGVERSYI